MSSAAGSHAAGNRRPGTGNGPPGARHTAEVATPASGGDASPGTAWGGTAGGGTAWVGTARGGTTGAGTAGAGAAARNAQQAVIRARHAASKARLAAESEAERGRLVRELFARPIRDHLQEVLGRPVAVLRAGCQAPIEELGLEKLRASGYEISVTTVDQDSPATRPPAPHAATKLGDLRMVSLPPRSFDIVYCGFLLERISHAALVLDRFVAALRPGGLLLLRVRDRDCAAAALDRMTPEPVRRMIWARLRPGEPGPFPAIYDPVTSARGLQAYALSHGLVIIRRETARTLPGSSGRLASAIGAARALTARLSRGRLTDAHDELLYVIRKPEDRFARLV